MMLIRQWIKEFGVTAAVGLGALAVSLGFFVTAANRGAPIQATVVREFVGALDKVRGVEQVTEIRFPDGRHAYAYSPLRKIHPAGSTVMVAIKGGPNAFLAYEIIE